MMRSSRFPSERVDDHGACGGLLRAPCAVVLRLQVLLERRSSSKPHQPVDEQFMRGAGIEDASFHTLRHTAASFMVQSGVPLYEVQKILGHSTPLMTERQAHLRA